MRLSLKTILYTAAVFSAAYLIGDIVHVLSIDVSPEQSPNMHMVENYEDGVLGKSDDHLLWFIQLSDLHLSIFQDKPRIKDFNDFCKHTIDIIAPSVVLASGDLTDAKHKDKFGSGQYIEEWELYYNTLMSSNVLNKTVWLDIRGNHDNFDVPALGSKNNFYQKYSIQGQRHLRSYMHVLRKGSESFAFIAVDACLLPGPRRPFNFIGVLTPSEIEALLEFKKESNKHNHTVWFGHYPTSCILSPEPGIRKVMDNGLAYLCGHLHQLGGLVSQMYTRQKTGSLELELGDWKDARLFRIAAIDHGLFSFVDVLHGQWPVILVTNPKHALFMMPKKEPVHSLARSTHVRVLIWSLSELKDVRIQFNEDGKWIPLARVSGPLWTAPWNPKEFLVGSHILKVYACDEAGRKNEVTQPFSLDGTQLSFRFWPRALLMSNISMVFQFFFGIMVCLCVIPLCIVRFLHQRIMDKKMLKPRIGISLLDLWLQKMWILVTVNRLFWPIMISTIYLPIGPWFVGEVLEGHIGVVFAWGTFVYNSYLPGSLTYGYGFFQILTFQLPLILGVAHCSHIRLCKLYLKKNFGFLQYAFQHVLLIIPIFLQISYTYLFWLAYGNMAVIIAPLRTWSALLAIYLWYQTTNLPKSKLRDAAAIWCIQSEFTSFRDDDGNPFKNDSSEPDDLSHPKPTSTSEAEEEKNRESSI